MTTTDASIVRIMTPTEAAAYLGVGTATVLRLTVRSEPTTVAENLDRVRELIDAFDARRAGRSSAPTGALAPVISLAAHRARH